MTIARTLFIVAAVFEALLSIPFVSWTVTMGLGGGPLFFAFGLHIAAFIFASREKMSNLAPITGIVASVLGWIPIISWIPHAISFIFYLMALISPQGPEPEKDEEKKLDDVVRDAEIVEDVPPVVPSEE